MRRSLCAAALLVPVLAGCTSARPPAHPSPAAPDPTVQAAPYRLASFDSCAPLLRSLKDAAKASVGPYGLPSGHGSRVLVPAAATPGARGPAESDAPGAAGSPEHSGTNVQEAGVEEPDLVKTDGRRIVLVSGNMLRVVDAATRRQTGSLALPDVGYGGQLLLSGDRALVIGGMGMGYTGSPIGPRHPTPYLPQGVTGLSLVDLSGAAPRLLGTLSFNSIEVDARQVGSTARIVLSSIPDLTFPYLPGARTDALRIAANRKVIERAGIDAWLPKWTLTAAGRTESGRVDCGAVSVPAKFSGGDLLSVLTLDLSADLGNGDPVTLATDGDLVYATATNLYVANDRRWEFFGDAARAARASTEIYQLDISGTARPRLLASGLVPGSLLNSYAMSEYQGRLRVASTVGLAPKQSSSVTVLARDGSRLRVTGSVGGLGKGEQIYAVRYAGPVAYVVTFRQTDPLYTVDLRDPDHPAVAGELQLTGFSSYLHPQGADRLIGVGQEATTAGRTTGMQVSVFDVTDPARPARTARLVLSGMYPTLAQEPHAFLYWAPTGTVVVPVASDGAAGRPRGGALVLHVGDGSITQVGSVRGAGEEAWSSSLRSLVVGGTLWTLTYDHLLANDLGTLAPLASLAITG